MRQTPAENNTFLQEEPLEYLAVASRANPITGVSRTTSARTRNISTGIVPSLASRIARSTALTATGMAAREGVALATNVASSASSKHVARRREQRRGKALSSEDGSHRSRACRSQRVMSAQFRKQRAAKRPPPNHQPGGTRPARQTTKKAVPAPNIEPTAASFGHHAAQPASGRRWINQKYPMTRASRHIPYRNSSPDKQRNVRIVSTTAIPAASSARRARLAREKKMTGCHGSRRSGWYQPSGPRGRSARRPKTKDDLARERAVVTPAHRAHQRCQTQRNHRRVQGSASVATSTRRSFAKNRGGRKPRAWDFAGTRRQSRAAPGASTSAGFMAMRPLHEASDRRKGRVVVVYRRASAAKTRAPPHPERGPGPAHVV